MTGFDAKKFLSSLTHRPGVYRMLDAQGEVLYVGKARDLKKRVASYFGSKAHHPKTQALMSHVERVDVTVTPSEPEALLLEYNLIKTHRPRFNVLLRDDKSYPYIHVSTEQAWPRFRFHRGSRKGRGRYFGPYPNADAVRQALGQLQKLFLIRPCTDSFFRNRSRPCLQYQIRRCSAPCVGLVSEDHYQRDVRNALSFLEGRNDAVLDDLVARMEDAAAATDYEAAARYRDQITAIRTIQAQQAISGSGGRDADVVAAADDANTHCIAVIMIRNGRVLGNRNFFPRTAPGTAPGEVLGAFLVQHYLAQQPPAEILVSHDIEDRTPLEQLLTERSGHRVQIRQRVRGDRRRWVEMARTNAQQGVAIQRAEHISFQTQFEALGEALSMGTVPGRIECFDISHTAGEETMAACVVFGEQGPRKSDYRRYRIRNAAAGDDYAAIAEAIRRRYARVRKDDAPLPDLVLIDGGKGQLGAAAKVLHELQISGVGLAGIAKGPGRRAAFDRLFVAGQSKSLPLRADSPALHLVQQIRDEAHRFAITGHRQRRGRSRRESSLEAIAGLGPVRRRALLRRFGGLQGVRRAGVDDLAQVRGISRALAERVYDHLHGGNDQTRE